MACVISIPDEVLVSEIFMKLPASCIMKLRRVCRSWRRLTTDPSFVHAHTRIRRRADAVSVSAEPIVYQLDADGRTTKDGVLRLLKLDAHDDYVVSPFEIRTTPGSGFFRLIASCDGLLCFQPDDDDEEPKLYYYVCNPVTRIWTTIAAAIAPDRGLHNQYLCGFYFHRTTGKYRLLRYLSKFITNRPLLWLEGVYEVAAVGGEDRSWRRVGEVRLTVDWDPAEDMGGAEALALFGLEEHGCIAVNGSLHWLHSTADDELGVVAFDTESEKFSRISAPVGLRDRINPPDKFQMNKIRGNLCLGRITMIRYGEEMMELWMLKDYAMQLWVKLHTIQRDRQGFVRTVRPQGGVCHDGDYDVEVDGELLVRWDEDSFGLYNFKHKTYNRMKNTTFDQNNAYYMQDFIYYTESLVDHRTYTS